MILCPRQMLKRTDWERQETQYLASYGARSSKSSGRVEEEKEHEYRNPFQRDRDRIIHSTAFRRLEYKTQVFVNHEGDYFRTRLTHTIEVSQISSTIGRALRLNEDLISAISLAHDLGHTPFGHAGERALDELMRDNGGFEHNRQSLRVVDKLEKRYPAFSGLNLTQEVREGIIKHNTPYDAPELGDFEGGAPTLEAQVVNIADEIAYTSHDLDDGLTSGLIDIVSLGKIELWNELYESVEREYPDIEEERKIYAAVRGLIDTYVGDALKQTEKNLEENKVCSIEDVRRLGIPIVDFSPKMKVKNHILRDFLQKNLYSHSRIIEMSNRARRIIKRLFIAYCGQPSLLPPGTQSKLTEEKKERVVCDYIAGMTDRFAQQREAELP